MRCGGIALFNRLNRMKPEAKQLPLLEELASGFLLYWDLHCLHSYFVTKTVQRLRPFIPHRCKACNILSHPDCSVSLLCFRLSGNSLGLLSFADFVLLFFVKVSICTFMLLSMCYRMLALEKTSCPLFLFFYLYAK